MRVFDESMEAGDAPAKKEEAPAKKEEAPAKKEPAPAKKEEPKEDPHKGQYVFTTSEWYTFVWKVVGAYCAYQCCCCCYCVGVNVGVKIYSQRKGEEQMKKW